MENNLFHRLILANEAKSPGRPAIQVGDQILSYENLSVLVQATARKLSMAGLREGDRVIILFPNSPEYVIAFWAITALGGTVVPVDIAVGAERLSFLIRDTGSKICLHGMNIKVSDQIIARTYGVCIDLGGNEIILTPDPGTPEESRVLLPEIPEESTAAIFFTAGSTGRPKGVVLRHKHLLAAARNVANFVGMNEEHRDLIISPMCHSGGWQHVSATLYSGGCIVIVQRLLSAAGILKAVQRSSITGFFAPPPLIRLILKIPSERVLAALFNCRSVETGTAPLAPQEVSDWMQRIPSTRLLIYYGLTECSRALTLDTQANPKKVHTVGRPARGVEIEICDEKGDVLGPNREGQVLLRGAQQSEAYWNRPDLNAERFRSGWLLTGDFGRLDEDGFLSYLGRRDDMINSGGYHYFPSEVETELGPVKGLAQYLIVGEPDPRNLLGQIPCAFVVPETPVTWSAAEFLSAAGKRLPSHMVPQKVVVVPSIPLTTSGKPSRRQTLELYSPSSQNPYEAESLENADLKPSEAE